ncbi:serine/threonine protein kinase [bacterium]|nr:serine/threonine protein kinase [bacterium]
MSELLEIGQKFNISSSNLVLEVVKFLGAGGQGEVYQAKLGSSPIALKWYFRHAATEEQLKSLNSLVQKGPPSETFLWPIELVSSKDRIGFGYLMPLREVRFKSLFDLMKNRVDPSFMTLSTVGLNLSHGFLLLHSKGFCYRDISFGNVFFDPQTGDILICDNDNVAVNGETSSSIAGTLGFMAPELVRNEAKPCIQTDLFSLSVLLFYMFILNHPFEGKMEASIDCFDQSAKMKLYGLDPVFIFDPVDRSNEPVPGIHDAAIANWKIYPRFLKDLFIKAFTKQSLSSQPQRVRESEWKATMARLRDAIFYCSCGSENFFDDEDSSDLKNSKICWNCKKEAKFPFRVRFGSSVKMLNIDSKIYPHHIYDSRLYDFSQILGEVSKNPKDPSTLGIKNTSEQNWKCITIQGRLLEIEPGRSVAISPGTKIDFGSCEGIIEE